MAKRKNTPSIKSLSMYEDIELNGMSYREAAAKYHVVESTVRANVKSVRAYRLQVFQEESEEPELTAVSDLLRLEMQYSEAMQAWRRSQQEAARDGTRADVRFLQLAQRLLADIRKLREETRSGITQLKENVDECQLTPEQRREAILSIVGYPSDAAAAGTSRTASDRKPTAEVE